MNSSKFYIITEGKNDAIIIDALIENIGEKENFSILTADGFSALLSKAGTVLITESDNVIVLTDSDSNDESKIKDREIFIKYILRYEIYKNRLKIILSKPEIEIAFFNNKSFFEDFFKMEISNIQWKQMQQAPKQYLHFLFNQEVIDLSEKVLTDKKWKAQLLQSSIRKEINDFYNQQMLVNAQ